jgi:hypothetical protein
MVNYENGKIYKLVNDITGLTYYGSTCQPLSKRKHHHKNLFKNNYKHMCMSRLLFEEHPESVDIVLIENFPCQSKEQLHAREKELMTTNDCVNKNIPFRTKEEHREYQCQWASQWRNKNPEKCRENTRNYVNKNRDTVLEQRKQRRLNNIEKCREKDKEYREKRAGKQQAYMAVYNNKKYTCECGSTLNWAKKSYNNTKKHLHYLDKKK